MKLNQGQTAALAKLNEFMVSEAKYFTLEAPGGFGKTTVITELEGDLHSINRTLRLFNLPAKSALYFCASTNKAASLFGDAYTIHKLLHLKVQNNYKTGKSYLVQHTPVNLINTVIVIDEASMLDTAVLKFLDESTDDSCKIIFLLDHCQLAPVGEEEPTVHTKGFPKAELTEPMRQGADSFLYQQCLRYRMGVLNQTALRPQAGAGVSIVTSTDFTTQMVQAFRNKEDVRVLAFTNDMVERLNRYIRHQLNGDSRIRVGDTLTMAAAKEGSKFNVEGMYTVMEVSPGIPWGKLQTEELVLQGKTGLVERHTVPLHKEEYFSVLKELKYQGQKEGNWKPYFTFLNTISDFRDVYACTVHKSQGSTYDKVFVDFQNISTCPDINTLVRLLYVAISRARHGAIYYTGE